ncbi:hypothetical protein HYX06_02265 [Candidatus Woesearchaeota archaeon]|nr:hypothetical protein [Candidatus Woesearchaeota archaeon]
MSSQKLERLIGLLKQDKDKFTWKHRTIIEAVIKKLENGMLGDARSILNNAIRMGPYDDFAQFASKLEYKIQRIGEKEKITIKIISPAPNSELVIGEQASNLRAEVVPTGAERGLAIEWIIRGIGTGGNEREAPVDTSRRLSASISERPVSSIFIPGTAVLYIELVDYGKPRNDQIVAQSKPVQVFLKRKEENLKIEISEVSGLPPSPDVHGRKSVKIHYERQPIAIDIVVYGHGDKYFSWSFLQPEIGKWGIVDEGSINLTGIDKFKHFRVELNKTFEPGGYMFQISCVKPDGLQEDEIVFIDIENPAQALTEEYAISLYKALLKDENAAQQPIYLGIDRKTYDRPEFAPTIWFFRESRDISAPFIAFIQGNQGFLFISHIVYYSKTMSDVFPELTNQNYETVKPNIKPLPIRKREDGLWEIAKAEDQASQARAGGQSSIVEELATSLKYRHAVYEFEDFKHDKFIMKGLIGDRDSEFIRAMDIFSYYTKDTEHEVNLSFRFSPLKEPFLSRVIGDTTKLISGGYDYVIRLVFKDDTLGLEANIRYVLLIPREEVSRVKPLIQNNPSIVIEVFKKVFPGYDRSSGRLKIDPSNPGEFFA